MNVEVSDQPAPDKLIGEILANRYQIERRLGEGAMGTVYRARHIKVGRPFAVKVLHRHLLLDDKLAQRFEREAELAGRLRHVNVVSVVDVGETTDGLRYMVMDFAEGEDLAAMLVQAPMQPERIVHLTRQLLEGLYHAHEQGLIHRDFKPENVIVETDMHGAEVPRIVDFGIAILREGADSADGQGRLTTNGLVLGTPHYMAPEQAVADPLDHRLDLFALGIVIYEMLCGKLPFDGTGAEVARANLLLDPPPIAKRVPYLEVDPLLEAFARRLMAKKRDDRPVTAKAARELLDLVDSDRTAAAAALGVPIETSPRLPAVTQPHAPQPRAAAKSNDTSTPPLSSTALGSEPPPANALRIPMSQRDLDTAVAVPLESGDPPPPPRVRRWIFAGLGLVLAGGSVAFALRGGGDRAAERPAQPPTADRAAEPPAQPPTADTVVMAPPPPAVVVVDRGSAAPGADVTTRAPRLESNGPKASRIGTRPAAKLEDPRSPRRPGGTQPELAQPEVEQPEVKQPEVEQPQIRQPEVKPEVKQPQIRQPEVKPEVKQPQVSPPGEAAALAARYRSVGQRLAALGPAGNDLWPRYRLIRIQDVMATAEKRAEAANVLAKLERDIAALQH